MSFSLRFACLICAVPLGLDAKSLTWTGDGSDDNWSTPGNWDPAEAPADGDSLDLPTGSSSLDLSLNLAELKLGEFGALGQANISGSGTLTVGGTLDWRDGRLDGTGALSATGTHNFSELVDLTGWNTSLGGTGSAANASFQFEQILSILGELRVTTGTSFSGRTQEGSTSNLIISGTLEKNAQTGAGDPAGSDDSTSLNATTITHQGTVRATQGSFIFTAPVESIFAATSETGADGSIEFRRGGRFGINGLHQFSAQGPISLTGIGDTYTFGEVANNGPTPVAIASTTLSGGTLNAAEGAAGFQIQADVTGPITFRGPGRHRWIGGTFEDAISVNQEGTLILASSPIGRVAQGEVTVAKGATVEQLASLNLAAPESGPSPQISIQGAWKMGGGTSLTDNGADSALVQIDPEGALISASEEATERATVTVTVGGQGIGSGSEITHAILESRGATLALESVGILDRVRFKIDNAEGALGNTPGRIEINGAAFNGQIRDSDTLMVSGSILELAAPIFNCPETSAALARCN